MSLISTRFPLMKLYHPTAELLIPDDVSREMALGRITHLGIGAHQDDLEFMAFHGIMECYQRDDRWFGGVTCTNGSGSARLGPYAAFTDEEMMKVRRNEQNDAARIGEFGAMFQLDYSSAEIKNAADRHLQDDLKQILIEARPEIVYTHNPADKHDTHIGVTIATLKAIRELPLIERPKQLIGCEVWRGLDWLADGDKVLMDVSGHDVLAARLNGLFDSQIAGGKRYDLATLGRRSANATFFNSHTTDASTQMIYGMDLTPLILDDSIDPVRYVCELIDQFKSDVEGKLARQLG